MPEKEPLDPKKEEIKPGEEKPGIQPRTPPDEIGPRRRTQESEIGPTPSPRIDIPQPSPPERPSING